MFYMFTIQPPHIMCIATFSWPFYRRCMDPPRKCIPPRLLQFDFICLPSSIRLSFAKLLLFYCFTHPMFFLFLHHKFMDSSPPWFTYPSASVVVWNTYATIRRPSLTSAYIRYNPSPEDQKRASLQGMSGLFIVEYDVERTTHVGEVMVRYGHTNRTQSSQI